MINKDLLADLDQLDQQSYSQQDNIIQEQNVYQNDQKDKLKLQQYGVDETISQNTSKLLTIQKQKLLKHIQKINKSIDQQINNNQIKEKYKKTEKQQLLFDISKSNNYAYQIIKQINSITKYIKTIYNRKIPQLDCLVPNNKDYCKAIYQIQQDFKKQKSQQFLFLSSHQRISLQIAISAPRQPLSNHQQNQVLRCCKNVIELLSYYQCIMIFLQTVMKIVAPNLCSFIGSNPASRLIALAGGIDKLVMIPACNIQVMGGNRTSQVGFSQLQRNHTGIFWDLQMVKQAPPDLRMKVVRMLATGVAKCVRADHLGTNNQVGFQMLSQIQNRIQKLQQKSQRQQKPLQIPGQQPKKKRGGKRHRRQKQLYQMSQLRKNQNKMKFGQAQQQMQDGVGLGMIKSNNKIKHITKKQKLKISEKMQKRLNNSVSGFDSTLNLTARTGIQLINPALKNQTKKGTQSYFAKQSGFRTVLNQKLGK